MNEALLPFFGLRQGYRKLFEMIVANSEDPSNTTILELGCDDGYFVEWLRQVGYDAVGVDGNKKAIESSNSSNVHHGELTALDDVIGDKTFNLVVERGVFSIPTQFAYIFDEELKLSKVGTIYKKDMTDERMGHVHQNIEQILENAFRHLKPRGFLLCLSWMPSDPIAFSEETAANVGYSIVHYQRNEAILQKPLSH